MGDLRRLRRSGSILKACLAVVALSLLLAPGAVAATPRQIYQDYADNGRLDGHYSSADLRRALQSASVQGYGKPSVKIRMKPAIIQRTAPPPAQRQRGTLPFTGLDLGVIVAGGALLLLVGAGLRVLGRRAR